MDKQKYSPTRLGLGLLGLLLLCVAIVLFFGTVAQDAPQIKSNLLLDVFTIEILAYAVSSCYLAVRPPAFNSKHGVYIFWSIYWLLLVTSFVVVQSA